uniref:Zgc:158868 n=1 Tax=Oryzias sinensis TaxID=183150 RepID=A0A8C8DQ05_9TELE
MSCRRSAVINVSTLLSSIEKCPETFAMAPMYPYRISKAALNMLTCCQAENFRADDILVAAMHPGWVRTNMGGEEVRRMVVCLTVRSSQFKSHLGCFLMHVWASTVQKHASLVT